MTDIYNQHSAAFSRVSAYVVLRDGERVATVAFKFPADGAGRLYAYVHWFGTEMVRGFASGCGYDKRSAAVAAAAHKMPFRDIREHVAESSFIAVTREDGGESWDRALENAGFTVFQAV